MSAKKVTRPSAGSATPSSRAFWRMPKRRCEQVECGLQHALLPLAASVLPFIMHAHERGLDPVLAYC